MPEPDIFALAQRPLAVKDNQGALREALVDTIRHNKIQ